LRDNINKSFHFFSHYITTFVDMLLRPLRPVTAAVRAVDSSFRAGTKVQPHAKASGLGSAEIVALDYHDLVAGKDLTKDIERGRCAS
jgi:hypothetical protein